MVSVAQALEQHASNLAEGEVMQARAFLHLGKRAAIDKALSRLVEKGRLQRTCQGMYVAPIETRFGRRPPAVDKVVRSISEQRGERVVFLWRRRGKLPWPDDPSADSRPVYLTAGPEPDTTAWKTDGRSPPRAEHWQLLAPERKAGQVIRALAWMGPEAAAESLERLQQQLTPEEREDLSELGSTLPSWLAELLSGLGRDG